MNETPTGTSRNSLFGKLAILIVLLILGVAMFGEKGVMRLVKLMRERENLSAEVKQLKEENERLNKEIQALRSDHKYLEQLARKELGMVREDEVVYQFRPKKSGTPVEKDEEPGGH